MVGGVIEPGAGVENMLVGNSTASIYERGDDVIS
jgi:hypothetical protein